jgi:type IV secretory pathway protease TraF
MQYAKYKGHILNSDADTRNLEGKGIVQILSPSTSFFGHSFISASISSRYFGLIVHFF